MQHVLASGTDNMEKKRRELLKHYSQLRALDLFRLFAENIWSARRIGYEYPQSVWTHNGERKAFNGDVPAIAQVNWDDYMQKIQ